MKFCVDWPSENLMLKLRWVVESAVESEAAAYELETKKERETKREREREVEFCCCHYCVLLLLFLFAKVRRQYIDSRSAFHLWFLVNVFFRDSLFISPRS